MESKFNTDYESEYNIGSKMNWEGNISTRVNLGGKA